MRMKFKVPYGNVITDAIWEKLKAIVPEIPEKQPDYFYGEYEGDIEKVVELIGPVEVTGKIDCWIASQLALLAEKINAPVQNVPTSVNQKVDVHVPGLGLLRIDEVQNFDDLCTDELQKQLDKGWRILAICVQSDQRRPDYILGRSRPNPAE